MNNVAVCHKLRFVYVAREIETVRQFSNNSYEQRRMSHAKINRCLTHKLAMPYARQVGR